MKAVVVVEYDLDDDAQENPLPLVVEALRDRLPSTDAATVRYIHLAIRESADVVMAAFAADEGRAEAVSDAYRGGLPADSVNPPMKIPSGAITPEVYDRENLAMNEWIYRNARGRDAYHAQAHRDLAAAQARLDAVRALCDEAKPWNGWTAVDVVHIRAALDTGGEM